MDYATYKKLRAYCWQDLEPYLNDPRLESTRRLNERLSEAVGLPELEHIEFEGDVAKNVFRKRDVTPRELAAAQLLSVASDNWARTYRTEPGRRRAHTYPAITPTEAADRWRKAHAAASEYAAFLPEREAAAMLAMLRDSGQATPAPVVADSASNAPLDAPQPVTTGDVAHAFDGLRRWNEKAWKDTLGSPPKWLEACIALRGERGKRETRWNPVLIGAALVHNGHAKANSIRARFQTKPQLQGWLEAWKTYEADNFDTP